MAARKGLRDWTAEEEEKLSSLRSGGMTAAAIGRKLGRSLASVENKIKQLGLRFPRGDEATPDPGRILVDERGDSSEVVWTTDTPVRTADEALAKAEIDGKVWAVDRCVINSWEQAAKNAEGLVVKTPIWQVKLWLKRRRGFSREEMLREIVDALREVRKPAARLRRKPTSGVLAEVAIQDHHFGKLAWAPEVEGSSYDVAIARARYDAAARYLVAEAAAQRPAKILVVVGNDFYHVDRGDNTTTAGTPQDVDGRWQKAFVAGLAAVRDLVDNALEVAPVEIVCVPGNHDGERAFTLGVVLDAVYERDARVVVNNGPALKKRVRWGCNLIGFYHGHWLTSKRLERLPNEMAHHWPEDWAATSWREWHLGHVHSEHEDVWRFRASESVGDVIVRRLPSLCGVDRWHYEGGYHALGAAEVHFFDAEYGRLGYRTCPLKLVTEETDAA